MKDCLIKGLDKGQDYDYFCLYPSLSTFYNVNPSADMAKLEREIKLNEKAIKLRRQGLELAKLNFSQIQRLTKDLIEVPPIRKDLAELEVLIHQVN